MKMPVDDAELAEFEKGLFKISAELPLYLIPNVRKFHTYVLLLVVLIWVYQC